ncbi:hypothetical protein SNE40_014667 [Patella caerulea]|uniref:Protein-lysine N-methyltransferase SNE40_014667 n=1 Tax=Patella caerulea TaxID=87958 RepID=A0AAN8PDB9_PATCE
MSLSKEDILIPDDGRDFSSSELGTKDYWDNAYERELKNYKEIGDVGEIWFGEDSQDRIIRWLDRQDDINVTDSILDIGTGNGVMLIELAKCGFTDLTGIDYSPVAIQLAKNIAESKRIASINYHVADMAQPITAETNNKALQKKYQICVDKGTFDAISLMDTQYTMARDVYIQNVHKLLNSEGIFVITSCNWTKEQLLDIFASDFKFFKDIPTPTFKFGGQVGNKVTSLVLKPS